MSKKGATAGRVLGVLLLVSLGFNVYLAVRSTDRAPSPGDGESDDRSSSSAEGAERAAAARECPPRPSGREAAGDARRFADALELSDSEQQLLEERYREPRLARMEQLEQALDADEADFEAAFEALRGLYADEDRLIEELFGKDARDRLHDYEIDKRATILAIAATYAGLDWQQAIVW